MQLVQCKRIERASFKEKNEKLVKQFVRKVFIQLLIMDERHYIENK